MRITDLITLILGATMIVGLVIIRVVKVTNGADPSRPTLWERQFLRSFLVVIALFLAICHRDALFIALTLVGVPSMIVAMARDHMHEQRTKAEFELLRSDPGDEGAPEFQGRGDE